MNAVSQGITIMPANTVSDSSEATNGDYETFSQLTHLLTNVDNENAKIPLFKEILEFLLSKPYFAEDTVLMPLIKVEALEQQDFVTTRANTLVNEWKETFNALLLKKAYRDIGDLWDKQNKIFHIFKQLGHQIDFPDKKYQLYAQLVKTLAGQSNFQLSDFLATVFPPEAEIQGHNRKKRTLKEILAAVDDESIRHSLIPMLDGLCENDLWIEEACEERDFMLSLAGHYGNLGLVQSLLTPSPGGSYNADAAAVGITLKKAAVAGHLAVVQFLSCLTTTNKPNFAVMGKALEAAAEAGQFAIVEFLYDLIAKNNDNEAINMALEAAAREGKLNIVKFLHSRVSAHKRSLALEAAASAGKLDVIKFLHAGASPKEIKIALEYAAGRGHLSILEFLCSLADKVDAEAVAGALKAAAREGRLTVVQFLCRIRSENKPNEDAIRKAFRIAAWKGELSIVEFLSFLPTKSLNTRAVREALHYAMLNHKWLIVQYLCRLNTENKPDRLAISEILQLAMQANEWPMVHFICGLTSENKLATEEITKALKVVIRSKQWLVGQFICTLPTDNKPGRAAIEVTLKIAARVGQLALVKSICELTENNKPSQSAILEALGLAVKCKKFAIGEFLANLTADKKINVTAKLDALLLEADYDKETIQFFCLQIAQNKSGPSKGALHSLFKSCKQDTTISNLLNETIKIKELYERISELKKYGEQLKQQDAKDKVGEYVVKQAEKLACLTNEFVMLWMQNPADKNLLPMRTQFKVILKEGYQNMGKFCKIWNPILANTMGKLGFFAEVTRQNKIQRVEEMFNKMERSSCLFSVS